MSLAALPDRPLASFAFLSPSPWPQTPRLRDVLDFYTADPTRRHTVGSDAGARRVVALLEAAFGPDLPLARLDRTACRTFLEIVRVMPANYARRLPGFSLADAVHLSRSHDRRPRLTALSVNGYMHRLAALLNVAVAEGLIASNPAKGLVLHDPVRPADRRKPFSPAQLHAIFAAPLYQGCQNDTFGYARPGSVRLRRGRFWVPLISLYGGLRLNEACQLDVADVRTVEGVACLVVTATAEDGAGDKRVKTGMSERIVPIHSTLRRLGLLEDVAARRATGERKLFPELAQSAHSGLYSGPFSKWFRAFLAHAGAEAPRTSFHSFRHNFRDALRRGDVDPELALALGGWTPAGGPGRLSSAAVYGSGYPTRRLAEAIERVQHPLDVDLEVSPRRASAIDRSVSGSDVLRL